MDESLDDVGGPDAPDTQGQSGDGNALAAASTVRTTVEGSKEATEDASELTALDLFEKRTHMHTAPVVWKMLIVNGGLSAPKLKELGFSREDRKALANARKRLIRIHGQGAGTPQSLAAMMQEYTKSVAPLMRQVYQNQLEHLNDKDEPEHAGEAGQVNKDEDVDWRLNPWNQPSPPPLSARRQAEFALENLKPQYLFKMKLQHAGRGEFMTETTKAEATARWTHNLNIIEAYDPGLAKSIRHNLRQIEGFDTMGHRSNPERYEDQMRELDYRTHLSKNWAVVPKQQQDQLARIQAGGGGSGTSSAFVSRYTSPVQSGSETETDDRRGFSNFNPDFGSRASSSEPIIHRRRGGRELSYEPQAGPYRRGKGGPRAPRSLYQTYGKKDLARVGGGYEQGVSRTYPQSPAPDGSFLDYRKSWTAMLKEMAAFKQPIPKKPKEYADIFYTRDGALAGGGTIAKQYADFAAKAYDKKTGGRGQEYPKKLRDVLFYSDPTAYPEANPKHAAAMIEQGGRDKIQFGNKEVDLWQQFFSKTGPGGMTKEQADKIRADTKYATNRLRENKSMSMMQKYVATFGAPKFRGRSKGKRRKRGELGEKPEEEKVTKLQLFNECRRIARTYGPLYDSLGNGNALLGVHVLRANKNFDPGWNAPDEPEQFESDEKWQSPEVSEPLNMAEMLSSTTPVTSGGAVALGTEMDIDVDEMSIRMGHDGATHHHKVSREKRGRSAGWATGRRAQEGWRRAALSEPRWGGMEDDRTRAAWRAIGEDIHRRATYLPRTSFAC